MSYAANYLLEKRIKQMFFTPTALGRSKVDSTFLAATFARAALLFQKANQEIVQHRAPSALPWATETNHWEDTHNGDLDENPC